MISHRYRFAFVHIPRTGGTSIETALASVLSGRKHLYREEVETLPDGYLSFSVVRNPWDRIRSYYRWRLRPESTWVPEAERRVLERSFLNWLEFVAERRTSGVGDRKFLIAISNQADILANDDGLLVDYVGRYERIQDSFREIVTLIRQHADQHGSLLARFQLARIAYFLKSWLRTGSAPPRIDLARVELPWVNKTREDHFSYRAAYTPETRDLVAELFAQDVEVFGYTF